MKMKRFLAPNMREALKAVRDEQGPDAVILSNRRVGEYIEIIAALDYDEALVNQALRRVQGADEHSSQPDTSTENKSELSFSEASAAVRGGDSVRGDEHDEEQEVRVTLSERPAAKTSGTHVPAAALQALLGNANSQEHAARSHRRDGTHVTELELGAEPNGLRAMQEEIASLRDLLQDQVAALLWQNKAKENPARAQILRNLTRLGLTADIARQIEKRVGAQQGISNIHPWRAPISELANSLPTLSERLMRQGGVAAFVGPTGVGKTTTIAKIASRFAVRHGARDIALISTDCYRIGAQEQLRTFGRILNAGVFEANNAIELRGLLDRMQDYRLILIDTAGLSQRDMRLAEILDGLSTQKRNVELYLTLAATVQEEVISEIIEQFSQVKLTGCALTKIDEGARLGGVISALIKHQLPLAYLCDGQRVPDDLQVAERRKLWLVNKALEHAKAPHMLPDETTMAQAFGQQEAVNA